MLHHMGCATNTKKQCPLRSVLVQCLCPCMQSICIQWRNVSAPGILLSRNAPDHHYTIAIQDVGHQNSRRQGSCGHFDSSPVWGPREGRPCFFSELGTPRQQELHRHFTFPQDGRGYVAVHLMFGRLLMEATEPPCEMTEGMRLRFAHCATSSTPPHFVVNGMKIVA